MTDRIAWTAIVLVACFATPDLARAESGPAAPPPWDDYKLIVERNMFMRDRVSPRHYVSSRPEAPPPPERRYLLAGTILNGDQHVAFVEDLRTSVTTRITVGSALADGRVVEIALDYLVYQKGETRTRVAIGQSLEGAAPQRPAASAEPVPASATPAPASGTGAPAAAPAAGGAQSILERLRKRRQQEINSK
jgi:hypothetical protein